MADVQEVGDENHAQVLRVACGAMTKLAKPGHAEFILTYKSFERLGSVCLPV